MMKLYWVLEIYTVVPLHYVNRSSELKFWIRDQKRKAAKDSKQAWKNKEDCQTGTEYEILRIIIIVWLCEINRFILSHDSITESGCHNEKYFSLFVKLHY